MLDRIWHVVSFILYTLSCLHSIASTLPMPPTRNALDSLDL